MKDRPKDGNGRQGRREGETTPPRTRAVRLDTPHYEDDLDLYPPEETESVKEDDPESPVDPEEDWYWREPDVYWLEEGMWPWPEARPKKKEGPGQGVKPPADTPPVLR